MGRRCVIIAVGMRILRWKCEECALFFRPTPWLPLAWCEQCQGIEGKSGAWGTRRHKARMAPFSLYVWYCNPVDFSTARNVHIYRKRDGRVRCVLSTERLWIVRRVVAYKGVCVGAFLQGCVMVAFVLDLKFVFKGKDRFLERFELSLQAWAPHNTRTHKRTQAHTHTYIHNRSNQPCKVRGEGTLYGSTCGGPARQGWGVEAWFSSAEASRVSTDPCEFVEFPAFVMNGLRTKQMIASKQPQNK